VEIQQRRTSQLPYEKLHLRDLLVNFLHELYYKVDQFVLEHLFSVKVRDEKRDVIALPYISSRLSEVVTITNLDRFPPQDEERFSSLGQETCEFVDQDVFNLVCLLYPYADTDTVDARLDKDPFVLITRHRKRIEEDFW